MFAFIKILNVKKGERIEVFIKRFFLKIKDSIC